jgi:hypothetical protein
MRSVLAAVLVLAGFSAVQAQEAVPRDEALKIACQLCRDLPKMLATPIPTDPDVKRPVALRSDDRGLMVLPETKLRAAEIAKAGPEVMSLGQLWLLKAAPMVEGQLVKVEKLQIVSVSVGDDKDRPSPSLCALGVRKAADGRLELLVYGKAKEPLLHTPLTPISGKQDDPIEVSVEQQADGYAVTLKILGAYTASFPIGPSE